MRGLAEQLFTLLPTLALVGLTLSSVGEVRGAVAHGSHGRDHHRRLVQRDHLIKAIGAQEKKRKHSGSLIRRNADGAQCRVRSVTSSSSTATDASTPTTTSKAASTTDTITSSAVAVAAVASDNAGDWSSSASSSESSSAVPPAQASSKSSSVSSAASSTKNSGSKLGMAWPNGNWSQPGDPDYFGNYIGTKTSFYYTWSPESVGAADSLGVEFVPEYWCASQTNDWVSKQSSWPSSVKNALFWNEPNDSGQCNKSPGEAVSYWMNFYAPLRSKGIALGSAAPTSAPDGLDWVQNFITSCTGDGNAKADCSPDFAAIHYYDTDVGRFQAYVKNFHETTGLDIWVTEYACQNYNGGPQCSDDQTWTFHTTMAAWFDQQDYVLRYSPFGAMKDMQGVNQANALMNPDGSITSLGTFYIDNS